MSKKTSIEHTLAPDTTVIQPHRTNLTGATILGAVAGIATSAAMIFFFRPATTAITSRPPSVSPSTTVPSSTPTPPEIVRTPVSDAVLRTQNTIIDFYRNSKNNLFSSDDHVAIGVAVTSDGWVAVPEEAFAQAPADVVAVARGTESVIEKKITDPFSHITFVKIKREDLQVVPFADTMLPLGSSITQFNKSGNLSFGFLTNPHNHRAITPTSSETLDTSVETTTDRSVGTILFTVDGALLGVTGKKDITTPGTTVRDATKLLLKKNTFTRPKLSLTTLDLSALVTRNKQLPTTGALLVKKGTAPAVVKKSAAEIAGLKEGDVITKVDSIEINADNTLSEALSLYTPGTTIPITIWRGGATVELTVSL